MRDATETMVDLGLETFLKEKDKIREIYGQAPELGKLPTLLKLRQNVVERLAKEMKHTIHAAGTKNTSGQAPLP